MNSKTCWCVPQRELSFLCSWQFHYPSNTHISLFSSWKVFQVVLPVGENAAGSREHRPWMGPAQTEHKAADSRVGAGWEQMRHLHACRQFTLQILHKVPDDHADVSAVAHHQDVNRDCVEAVVGWAVGGSRSLCSWGGVRRWWSVLIQHVVKKDFEEFFESQLHLKSGRQWSWKINRIPGLHKFE